MTQEPNYKEITGQMVHAARNLLITALEIHEKICPEPHCQERANILAFLAHCLGATPADMRSMRKLLFEYEVRCGASGGCDVHRKSEAKPLWRDLEGPAPDA
jgi:hypothetical protein